MACPSDAELLDMLGGELAASRRTELEVHLDGCPTCLAVFAAAVRSSSRPPAGDADDAPLLAGAERYLLNEEIGRGGMGRVVAAYDKLLDRRVALKLVRTSGRGLARRFAREQRITARLQHPAIVPIYDAGRLATGEPFFAMRMVAGKRLDEAAAEARTLEDRLRLLPAVIGVVDAVAYAHGEGVIHRDLKPQNVLVGAFGEVVLVDWGLARATWTDDEPEDDAPSTPSPADVTREGEILGTLGYMAPEQISGETVDARADVYGLGAILYHVLAGKPPHGGRSESLSAGAIAHTPARLTEAPADLIAIVERAMAHDRTARYVSARELAEDLKLWQAGRMVEAHRYTLRELLGRFVRKHRTALAVAGGAFVILVVVAALGLQRVLSERARAEAASRLAVEERDHARSQRAAAETLIDFMLGDLRDRLDRLGRLDTLEGVAGAVLAYQEQTAEADGGEARTKAALLAGDVALATGDLAVADVAYERAAIATRAMPAGDAGDVYRCRVDIGRARTHRARGELDPAVAAFTACVTLAGDPPRSALRDVALDGRIGLAEVARQRGDLEGAQRLLDAALPLSDAAIAEHGAGSLRSGAALQVRFERWETLNLAGEVALALEEARAALALAEARHAAHPDDANLRHELAAARLHLGISEEEGGRLDLAEQAYRAALDEARAVSSHDPANTTWRRDVGVAADRLGNLMIRKHQLAAALEWLRLSDEQSKQLVALQPSNLDWQRDLGVSALALGDVLIEMRRFDEARVEVTRALDVLERIHAVAPGRATQDLGIALGHLADLEAKAGQFPAARAALGRSIELLRATLAASDTPETRHQLAAALGLLAGVESTSARQLALVTEARTILEPLRQHAADPDLAATFTLLDRKYKLLGGR